MISDTGFAVASTGAAVGIAVEISVGSGKGSSVGVRVEVPVGVPVGIVGDPARFPVGTTVGNCVDFVVGEAVSEFPGTTEGAEETRGASVGVCCRGASLQISLPPITLTGVMLAHCWAFCDGYPEFANVLPAINSN